MDSEPPPTNERRRLINQIIESGNGKGGILEEFFLLTGFEYLSKTNQVSITIHAARDNESRVKNYYPKGFLTGEFFYENEEPAGFYLKQQTQKRDIKQKIYFDRLRGFVRHYHH